VVSYYGLAGTVLTLETLSAMDMQGIGRVAANTTLAACAGGLVAMLAALWFGPTKGKFDLAFTINGFLAGLVAITAPCYWVSPLGAIMLRCHFWFHHLWWCLALLSGSVSTIRLVQFLYTVLTVSGVLYH
jgi:ammonia channel protein AmtB